MASSHVFDLSLIGKNSAARADDPELTQRLHSAPSGERDAFNRDAQRILHSARFRKLQDKMEIGFPGFGGESHRTALTLGMELVSMTTSDCRLYGLNYDLALAISLAQCLGAPPYGRVGLEVLGKKLTRGYNRYEYALYVLTRAPGPYSHPGLNPTRAVRDALLQMALDEGTPLGTPLDEDLDPIRTLRTLEGTIVSAYIPFVQAADYFEDYVNSRLATFDDLAKLLTETAIFQDFEEEKERVAVEKTIEAASRGIFDAESIPIITKAILHQAAKRLESALVNAYDEGTKSVDPQTFRYPPEPREQANELISEIETLIAAAPGYNHWKKEVKATIQRLFEIQGDRLPESAPPSEIIAAVLDSPESFVQRVNFLFQQVMSDLIEQVSHVTANSTACVEQFRAGILPQLLNVFNTPALALIDVDPVTRTVISRRTYLQGGSEISEPLSVDARLSLARDLFDGGRYRFGSDLPWWGSVFNKPAWSKRWARKLGAPLQRPNSKSALVVLCELPPTINGEPSALEIDLENSLIRPLLSLYFIGLANFETSVNAVQNLSESSSQEVKSAFELVRDTLHDLKGPVGVIARAISDVQDVLPRVVHSPSSPSIPDAEKAEVVRKAQEAIQLLSVGASELRKNIERSSRSASRQFERKPLALRPIIASVTALLACPGLRVEIDVPDDLYVEGVEAWIETIVSVILRNANLHAYRAKPGTAWVRASRRGPKVCLEIWNQGDDLDSTLAREIFSKYKRQQSKDNWRWGLYQVHRYVEALGGTIECHPIRRSDAPLPTNVMSEPIGPAYFRIILSGVAPPRETVLDDLPDDPAARSALDPLPTSPRVLVVDDSPSHRRLARQILDAVGCSVVEASCFAEAKRHIETDEFDGCLLDLDLGPGNGSGIELISLFARRFPKRRGIVMSSSVDDGSWREEARSKGAYRTIAKAKLSEAWAASVFKG